MDIKMKCKECNHTFADDLERCPVCGAPNPNAQAKQTAQETTASSSSQTNAERDASYSSTQQSYASSSRDNNAYGGQQTGYGYGPQQTYSGGYGAAYAQPYGDSQVAAPSSKLAVPSLILGILGLILPAVGLILAIIALVLGTKARKESIRGTTDFTIANAGWILGIVGTVLWGALLVCLLTGFVYVSAFLLPFEWM